MCHKSAWDGAEKAKKKCWTGDLQILARVYVWLKVGAGGGRAFGDWSDVGHLWG